MSDNYATNATTAIDSQTLAGNSWQGGPSDEQQGFIRRYRLPLFLAVVAVCLYAGSIIYILFGRGQIA